MSPEERQTLFGQAFNKLCEKYGVTLRAVVQEEQLGFKKLVWATPALELDPNWQDSANTPAQKQVTLSSLTANAEQPTT